MKHEVELTVNRKRFNEMLLTLFIVPKSTYREAFLSISFNSNLSIVGYLSLHSMSQNQGFVSTLWIKYYVNFTAKVLQHSRVFPNRIA